MRFMSVKILFLVSCLCGSLFVTNAFAFDESSFWDDDITYVECPEGFATECATVKVPLDWDEPSGKKIDIFFSKYPAEKKRRKGQMWLLDGGPGGNGASFLNSITTTFASFQKKYDIYVLQHRGLGMSSRMHCPDQEDPNSEGGVLITQGELQACLDYLQLNLGDGMGEYNITNAAKDLQYLIYRNQKYWFEPSFVYGISYGTFWAQRFLQVAPYTATGVILDSVVPPENFGVYEFDSQFDVVAQDLGGLCDKDEVCGDKMKEQAWQQVSETFAKVKLGHCSEVPGLAQFVTGFGQFWVQTGLRRHLFSLTYRMNRCNQGDVAALSQYVSIFSGEFSEPEDEWMRTSNDSLLLGTNIMLSEMAWNPISYDQAVENCNNYTFCPGLTVFSAQLQPIWPTYALDEYYGEWFDTFTPVLALNGDLDPQTPHQDARRIKTT